MMIRKSDIYIEDTGSKSFNRPQGSTFNIAEFSPFLKSNSQTSLLYSKFIVKGIKPEKTHIVRDFFQQQKNRQYTKSSTKTKTKESCHRQPMHDRQSEMSEWKALECHMNNFFQINSVRKPQNPTPTPPHEFNHHASNPNLLLSSQKRPQSAFQRSASHNKLTRPHTAKQSQCKKMQPQSKLNMQNMHLFDDFRPVTTKPNLLKISDDQCFKSTDFIKKNRLELASSKKSSFYLTGAHIGESRAFAKKHSQTIETIEVKNHNQNQQNIESNQMLTTEEREDIKKKGLAYEEFMKDNMPLQYRKYIDYLDGIQEKEEENRFASCRELLSKNLDSGRQSQSRYEQFQTQEAIEYYEQFYKVCENVGLNIKRNLIKKQIKKEDPTVLTIAQCKQILELYCKKIKSDTTQINGINNRIKQIVENLSYFKSQKASFLQKLFNLEYEIRVVQENTQIISKLQKIDQVFIILNGSARKIPLPRVEEEEEGQIFKRKEQKVEIDLASTLFDGEFFGLPKNPFSTEIDYSVEAVEKCLLMVVQYGAYKKLISENESINDRVDILKRILGVGEKGSGMLSKQDLQIIAFQMQTLKYNARALIVREGEISDKLYVISAGNAIICKEAIMKRSKQPILDVKKRPKSCGKLRVDNINIMRKENLINYQLIRQNTEELVFYCNKKEKQLIRGDTFNWVALRQNSDEGGSGCTTPHTRLDYSLMSTADNTRVYALSRERMAHLPQTIRKCIEQKAERQCELMHRTSNSQKQMNIRDWDQYKEKLTNQICKRKHLK